MLRRLCRAVLDVVHGVSLRSSWISAPDGTTATTTLRPFPRGKSHALVFYIDGQIPLPAAPSRALTDPIRPSQPLRCRRRRCPSTRAAAHCGQRLVRCIPRAAPSWRCLLRISSAYIHFEAYWTCSSTSSSRRRWTTPSVAPRLPSELATPAPDPGILGVGQQARTIRVPQRAVGGSVPARRPCQRRDPYETRNRGKAAHICNRGRVPLKPG